ncbi:MAG: hypothetical protein KC684_00535 [Candidatus Omnitrophica bacterium]|nr:hypothetical protein [Candidatus Omnitrophota bacterium]MCA9407093.1 hypothetical protein [Candidatus Omnitrophota bacterium]
MARKESEADDPIEMIGIQLPNQTEEQLRDMALCFAEEFVREGWSEEKLVKMFKNPFYQGPYMVWKQKGDAYVKSVIKDAVNMWRPNISRRRDFLRSNKEEDHESSI